MAACPRSGRTSPRPAGARQASDVLNRPWSRPAAAASTPGDRARRQVVKRRLPVERRLERKRRRNSVRQPSIEEARQPALRTETPTLLLGKPYQSATITAGNGMHAGVEVLALSFI